MPPEFNFDINGLKLLNKHISKNWMYAKNGRASLYHILKAYNVKSIFIPVYICETVLEPIKRLGLKVHYYDLDIDDLNPSFESFKKLYEKNKLDAVLVASMYGNPANMVVFENFCKKNDILLIDDAAQSFGAKLNDKYIGTFGNAGFFSFSPGKPLSGHLGSFFWINKKYEYQKNKNTFYHYFKWIYFKYNRQNIYQANTIISFLLKVLNKILDKLFTSYNHQITEHDKKIVGGILASFFNNKWVFREKIYSKFNQMNNQYIRLITNIRGTPNNHKLVFVITNKQIANQFKIYLDKKQIFFLNGYKLLSNSSIYINAQSMDGLIFELPMEDDEAKMSVIYEYVEKFDVRKI